MHEIRKAGSTSAPLLELQKAEETAVLGPKGEPFMRRDFYCRTDWSPLFYSSATSPFVSDVSGPVLKSASFSCCALMNASLKRFASVEMLAIPSHHLVRPRRNSLSLFANRIASVQASGSPSLTSAAAFHTQLRSLPTFGESFMSGTTIPILALQLASKHWSISLP